MILMTAKPPGRTWISNVLNYFIIQFYSRIINHHGQPIKVGSNGSFEPVKGILNGAFTTDTVTPRVGEVLRRKKIDKLDLISRNETVNKKHLMLQTS